MKIFCRSFYQLDVRDQKAVVAAVGKIFIYFENFHVYLIYFLDGVVRDYGGVDILLTSAGVADNVSYNDYSKQLFSMLIVIYRLPQR